MQCLDLGSTVNMLAWPAMSNTFWKKIRDRKGFPFIDETLLLSISEHWRPIIREWTFILRLRRHNTDKNHSFACIQNLQKQTARKRDLPLLPALWKFSTFHAICIIHTISKQLNSMDLHPFTDQLWRKYEPFLTIRYVENFPAQLLLIPSWLATHKEALCAWLKNIHFVSSALNLVT